MGQPVRACGLLPGPGVSDGYRAGVDDVLTRVYREVGLAEGLLCEADCADDEQVAESLRDAAMALLAAAGLRLLACSTEE